MKAFRQTPILARVGWVLLCLVAFSAVFAPWLAPFDPSARSGLPFSAPGAGHWLGTNDVGQDILSELLYGARVSLVVGLAAALAATAVGGVVGLVAGYRGGWVDGVLMRLVDATLALPFLPLVIVAGVFLGGGLGAQIAVIAAVAWAIPARELRPQMMSLRSRADVEAARVMGARTGYLLRRHLLPAVAPLLPPQLVRAANLAILTEASLSFLGLGNAGHPSWGNMLYYAQVRGAMLTDAWRWWVLPPGIAIAVTVVALAFIGFALEERVHPSLAGAREEPKRRGSRRRGTRVVPVVDPLAPALEVKGLTIGYPDSSGAFRPVLDSIDLLVGRGEVVGLVGRSGSGKSTLASAVMGQLRAPGRIAAGSVFVAGCDINDLEEPERRTLRGRVVALVPQDAMGALNPVMRVGDQIAEAIRIHRPGSRGDAARQAVELLELVDIPVHRARAYPHQFSGGMRQRAVLAMALAHRPALLIADEPTTGLDPVVRGRLLDLLERLHRELGMAVLLISHDLEAVIRLAGRVVVVEEGRVVETGTPAALQTHAEHRATQRLLAARMPAYRSAPGAEPDEPANEIWVFGAAECPAILRTNGLSKHAEPGRITPPSNPKFGEQNAGAPTNGVFESTEIGRRPPPKNSKDGEQGTMATEVVKLEGIGKRFGRGLRSVVAAENVSITIRSGEAVGLVGRSGAGKTTIARVVCGLDHPDRGRITINGRDLAKLDRNGRHEARRGVHLVFQDPYEALPANLRLLDIVAEPLVIQGVGSKQERSERARQALIDVALDPDRFGRRYPHELSGGERQRVAMARAIVGRPQLVVADEPAAMLDTVLASELADLIARLRLSYGMAWLLITHELGLAARVSDRLVVMDDGRVQDEGPTHELLAAPTSDAAGELVGAMEVRHDG